jgi:hypothetical protein
VSQWDVSRVYDWFIIRYPGMPRIRIGRAGQQGDRARKAKLTPGPQTCANSLKSLASSRVANGFRIGFGMEGAATVASSCCIGTLVALS